MLSLLVIAWCVLHSAMISVSVIEYFKKRLGSKFRFYRLFFNLIAILTLIPVALFAYLIQTPAILKHIRLVWASLWSDAALLYRQEIGLNVEKSTMAVVIQEIVAGDRSGVVFTRNPNDENQGVIESVYGLNQGLVDGTVEPDRWIIDRSRNTIVSHTPPERK